MVHIRIFERKSVITFSPIIFNGVFGDQKETSFEYPQHNVLVKTISIYLSVNLSVCLSLHVKT